MPSARLRLRCLAAAAAPAVLCLAGVVGPAHAQPTEQQMIDKLIGRIEAMKDARFVRNFKEYDAPTAAKFLREKFKAMGDGVKTCDEFIDRIATRSSMTGLAYKIRFADGREVPAAEFLRAELKAMRAAAAA